MNQAVSSLEVATVSAPCVLCRKVIHMGPVYEGRYVEKHNAIVCNHCWEVDRNGWRAEHEKFLSPNAVRLSIAEMQEQRRRVEEGSSIKVA